ncbi:3-hydroxyacyl-ACP dehydratase FabZ family protein [Jidongwangia harbinensis]|uniref:3-hydroxyacyl-ACP dehydratase FabZ family protein n=1 Tax=Jidongwangia harbinensis TaxID=2878561 RepID=UPI001CD93B8F|nr:beta-hydroxyacyl-ACP dehydratase [Jidongwangia harbinensis]MCA2215090.1 beta-hydroxyacyl-ACP dehydratase [Jidongwangia harbinensis]
MMDTAAIAAHIPHRYPMLLLDRVTAVTPGSSLVAVKAITATEPCYRREPGAPPLTDFRYPAPLLLESLAQAAVILATWDEPNPDVCAGRLELGASFRGVRFRQGVHPGDLVEHRIVLRKALGDTSVVSGVASVDGRPVLEVDQFVLAMRDVASFHTPDILPA